MVQILRKVWDNDTPLEDDDRQFNAKWFNYEWGRKS